MNIKNFIANLCNTNDRNNLSKWHIIWKGLCFYLLLMTSVALILNLCRKLFLPNLTQNVLRDSIINDILANRKLYIILQTIILVPISEEIIFRLGLSLKKLHVAIVIAFLSFYLVPNIFTIKWMSVEFFVTIIVAVIIFFMIFYFTKKEFWERLKSKYSKHIIYILMFLFAILHLINYVPFELKYVFNYVLIIIPHFIFAMVATYYRLNLGFLYCMLFHVLCNGYKTTMLLLT